MQLLSSVASYAQTHAALVSSGGVLACVNAIASNLGHAGVLRAGVAMLGRLAVRGEWYVQRLHYLTSHSSLCRLCSSVFVCVSNVQIK